MISEIYYTVKEDLNESEIDKIALLFNQIINTLPDSLDNTFILEEQYFCGLKDINDIGKLFYLNTKQGNYMMNHMLQPYSFIIKSLLLSASKLTNKIVLFNSEEYKEEQLFSYFVNKKIA